MQRFENLHLNRQLRIVSIPQKDIAFGNFTLESHYSAQLFEKKNNRFPNNKKTNDSPKHIKYLYVTISSRKRDMRSIRPYITYISNRFSSSKHSLEMCNRTKNPTHFHTAHVLCENSFVFRFESIST